MIAVLLIKHEDGEAEHLQICLDSLEQQTNKDFKVYETTPDSIDVAIQSILNDDLKQICYLDSFDFYLPEHNICIEYHGEQHYKPVKFFGGVKNLELTLKRDKIKGDYCIKNNIKLIVIPFNKPINIELNSIGLI